MPSGNVFNFCEAVMTYLVNGEFKGRVPERGKVKHQRVLWLSLLALALLPVSLL